MNKNKKLSKINDQAATVCSALASSVHNRDKVVCTEVYKKMGIPNYSKVDDVVWGAITTVLHSDIAAYSDFASLTDDVQSEVYAEAEALIRTGEYRP